MLNITNYTEHPSNPFYTVYTFTSEEVVEYFKKSLHDAGIYYEHDKEELANEYKYFVAVKKKDEKQATRLNYLAIGAFRKPFIQNKLMKFLIYVFSTASIGLALAGYCISD